MRLLEYIHINVQANVPTEATKNTRKGIVRLRTAGYCLPAAHSPIEPTAKPPKPPMVPPLTVSLELRKNKKKK